MTTNAKELVTGVLVDVLGIAPEIITPQADMRQDLGLDSLDGLELVVVMQDELGVDLTDDEIDSLRTVADAVELVERYLDKGRSA